MIHSSSPVYTISMASSELPSHSPTPHSGSSPHAHQPPETHSPPPPQPTNPLPLLRPLALALRNRRNSPHMARPFLPGNIPRRPQHAPIRPHIHHRRYPLSCGRRWIGRTRRRAPLVRASRAPAPRPRLSLQRCERLAFRVLLQMLDLTTPEHGFERELGEQLDDARGEGGE